MWYRWCIDVWRFMSYARHAKYSVLVCFRVAGSNLDVVGGGSVHCIITFLGKPVLSHCLKQASNTLIQISLPFIPESHDDVIKWKHFPRNWPFVWGPGEFTTQRPVTRSFDVFFDLRLNKRLSKQPWGWWFETLSWSLWRHCYGAIDS